MIIDEMIGYVMDNDPELPITLKIDDNVTCKSMVFEILNWMKLEYKRTEWIRQGKKDMRKPLQLSDYPWCSLLRKVIEENNEMHRLFQIKNNMFCFSDSVLSDEITAYLNKVNLSYNPDVYR